MTCAPSFRTIIQLTHIFFSTRCFAPLRESSASMVPEGKFVTDRQYKDARAMAAFDPITGKRFGRAPNASSKRSTGAPPFRRVSKLRG